jgi:hypothetical protein
MQIGWYAEQLSNTPNGEPVAYHKNLGVSEEEYKEFLELSYNIEAAPTDRAELLINLAKNENRINIILPRTPLYPTDKGSKNLIVKDSIAYYNGVPLKYTGVTSVDNEKNGLRSKWFGYTFEYEMPVNLSASDLKDIANLNYHSCKLVIGNLEKGNRSMIHIKEIRVENGKKTISTDFPLIYSNNQKISLR